MPMKLSAVSARIIAGIASVTEATIWLRKDGTRCLRMIAISPSPSSRAAMTKSSCLSAMNLPRTSRASPVQPISDRMMVMAK